MDNFLKWFATTICVGMISGCCFVIADANNAYGNAVWIYLMCGFTIMLGVFTIGKVWKLF